MIDTRALADRLHLEAVDQDVRYTYRIRYPRRPTAPSFVTDGRIVLLITENGAGGATLYRTTEETNVDESVTYVALSHTHPDRVSLQQIGWLVDSAFILAIA